MKVNQVSLRQVLESSIKVSREAYCDLVARREALPRQCFEQCELALFALIDDYESQLEQVRDCEPEPCLFPQRCFCPEERVWVTGSMCYSDLRPECEVEAYWFGWSGLDAVAYLPTGGISTFDCFQYTIANSVVSRG